MRALNVAIIGTGWCGGIRAETSRNSPFVGDLHIAETNAARLQAMVEKVHPQSATDDYRKLLAIKDVDAVIVSATPEGLHYPMAKESLLAGKHVVLEKPMALTPAENFLLVADSASGDVAVVRLTPMPRGEKISTAEAILKGQNPSKDRGLVTVIPVGVAPTSIAIKIGK